MDLTPDRSDRALRGSALFGSPWGGRLRRRFAVCAAALALAAASLTLAGPVAAPAYAVPATNGAVGQLNMRGQSDWTDGQRESHRHTVVMDIQPQKKVTESTLGDDDLENRDPPGRQDIGNVLVVGDSISNGYEGNYTWRQRLWDWTRDEGVKATFVGPLTGTHVADEPHAPEPPPAATPPSDQEPDPARFAGLYAAGTPAEFLATGARHYAMWGRRLGQSTNTITSVMKQLKEHQELPDVVLVELGFNDIGWLGAGPGLVPTMRQFIDNVRAVNPNARIVVGNVPQRTTLGSANPQLPQRTTDYNNALAAALPTWSTATSPVALADIDAAYGCNPAATTCESTYDGLHPNAMGEYRIARAFGSTLHRAFGIGDEEPRDQVAVPPFSIVTPADLQFDGTQQGVTVTWPKILGAHSYDVEWRDTTGDPDAAWQPAGPVPANRFDLSWQFTGQPYEGHTYQVRVRAVAGDTDDRKSGWSQAVSGTAHPTTAAPPETVTVTPGAGAVDVTWTPATGPHSDTITRYALWVYDQDTPLVWPIIRGYDPSTHSARVEGLTPGHHYVAFVCTWNAAGEGKPRIPDAVVVR
ncbi:GDSL-type esterase/lipase family protein [Kitasatospora sp. NBC_01300]|uniref:GDSL-type esterase/lipase family protein n=1 Tax=Kitasatospora sp. NBC_01300 TaxID=2903574 RepID=UPI002F90E349|nr:GDSL-type esterase/lipase family protein [Kitasatospora sp. NBC_01300]